MFPLPVAHKIMIVISTKKKQLDKAHIPIYNELYKENILQA